MKKPVLLFAAMLCSLHITYSQSEPNIEITSSGININSGSEKTYYNGKEIATGDDLSRSATFVIAASNASEKSKQGADYVCTGTNDEVIILAVMNALPNVGGKISLTEGNFNISNSITLPASGALIFEGVGDATSLVFANASLINIFARSEIGTGRFLFRSFSVKSAVNNPLVRLFYLESDSIANTIILDSITFFSINLIFRIGSTTYRKPTDVTIVRNCIFENENSGSSYNDPPFIYGKRVIVKNNIVKTDPIAGTYFCIGNPYENGANESILVDGNMVEREIQVRGKNAIITNNRTNKLIMSSYSWNCLIINNMIGTIQDLGTGNKVLNNYTPIQ
jgi:hypothetical protein